MKTSHLKIFTISILALNLYSCGKTTAGKVTNFWNIDSFSTSQTISYSDISGSFTQISKTSGDDKNYTSFDGTGGGQIGTIQIHTLNIKNDGTWELRFEYKTESNQYSSNITDKTILRQTGTWAFLDKDNTKEFKKNERIMLNTLKEELTTIETSIYNGISNPSQTNSISNTYLTGEKVTIYTIKESTTKKLSLSSEGNNTIQDTDSPGANQSFVTTNEMTLTKL